MGASVWTREASRERTQATGSQSPSSCRAAPCGRRQRGTPYQRPNGCRAHRPGSPNHYSRTDTRDPPSLSNRSDSVKERVRYAASSARRRAPLLPAASIVLRSPLVPTSLPHAHLPPSLPVRVKIGMHRKVAVCPSAHFTGASVATDASFLGLLSRKHRVAAAAADENGCCAGLHRPDVHVGLLPVVGPAHRSQQSRGGGRGGRGGGREGG